MTDSLLYPMFETLRDRGVPLGISEYMAAVEALRNGLFLDPRSDQPEPSSPNSEELPFFKGLDPADMERMRRMLRLLWAKRREDLPLVDAGFAEFIVPRLKPVSVSAEKTGRESEKMDGQSRKEAEQHGLFEQEAHRQKGQSAAQADGASRPKSGGMTRSNGSSFQDTPLSTEAVFCMTPRPPVGLRRAVRTFRALRRPVRMGISTETDIPATITRVCSEGYLVRPVLKLRWENLSVLRVLLDYGGSMTPFSPVLNPIVEALQSEGKAGRLRVEFYYFHDCPANGLFSSRSLADPVDLEQFFAAPSQGISILLISDAGAARGDYDGRRIDDTRCFMERLFKFSPRLAWINPVPALRWSGSSAEGIAAAVSMFDLDRQGLEDAVLVLRGGKGVG